jgi:hypothetical protein
MLLLLVMAAIIAVGLTAIALAEPRRQAEIVVWNDDVERRLLSEGKVRSGWW